MDERYLLAAARYVELNPVRAKLVEKPEVYSWSSAAAYISGRDDVLVKVSPLLAMVKDWRESLSEAVTEQQAEEIRRHERTGRPLGDENFVVEPEKALNRILRCQKPGPKREVSQR